MKTRTATVAGACVAALVLASPVAAFAGKPDKPHPTPKPDKPHVQKGEVGISKLQVIRAGKERDVATADAVIKAHVQVKDRSKQFSPDSVVLKLVEKSDSGEVESTLVVDAVRAGASKVVTNWHARVTVPQGSVAPGGSAVYCVRVVKAADATSDAPLDKVKAKGLRGRDCVTVVNSAPA